MTALFDSTTTSRYNKVAIALHWLIGVALLGQIVFGFLLDELAPRGTPGRAAVINLHKSCGIVLALLIAARLAWRLAHKPPALSLSLPRSFPVWQQKAATLGHSALYACMVVMPLSGYIGSNFSKHGVKFFGIALRPWGPDLPSVYGFFNGLHIATAWIFTLLIVGHIAMAAKHGLIDRNGLFSRMWPWGTSR